MATKKTTKFSPEQEYRKELRRILQFMRRAGKRGFIWTTPPLPKRPKTITEKSVKKLKRITPDVLYKKGQYVVEETGELISGTKGRKLERKSKKPTNKKPVTIKPKGAQKQNKKKQKPNKESKRKPATHQDTTPDTDVKPIHTPSDDEHERQTADDYFPSFTDIVLSNFHAQLSQFPNAEGTRVLLAWLDKLISDNGREAVAQMLQDGAEQGIIITWEVVYKAVNTKTYMAEMMRYLPDQGEIYAKQMLDMMEQFEWWEMPE